MTRLTVARLSRDIEDFLVFKRALGFSYRRSEATLRSFERFARSQARPNGVVDLGKMIRTWLVRIPGRKPVTLSLDLGALRQLCHFRRRRDPTGFLPAISLAPETESHYLPYIFSYEEICRLLRAAAQHRGRNFWAEMLRLLILVTYCTGLRFGEAVRLQCSDVDLRNRVLHIRESKGRSRLVPFGADLAEEFQRFWPERRNMLARKGRREESAVFVGRNGRPITLKAASDAVRRLLRQLGLKSASGRTGPRPYDLRHAFAVHRLTAWYREGVDIHARLPWLSAYMGHVNVLGTEVYLHATPELLQLASERFAKRVGS